MNGAQLVLRYRSDLDYLKNGWEEQTDLKQMSIWFYELVLKL